MKNLIIIVMLISSSSSAQNWETNFQKAKTLANESKNNIVLVFSGSDWCAPCIKLDNNIWQSDEFQSHAKKNWVLLKADFPRKKSNKLSKEQTKLNSQLADKYNQNGIFPLVVILDYKGNVLGQTSYKNISPAEYVALLKGFKS